ncbi:hypothetical protein BDF21DRAFT_403410 [Thamnidium elegans]|nr:hypothetical protein BDF21DRAFT_403410 [Thamnidium elegans]
MNHMYKFYRFTKKKLLFLLPLIAAFKGLQMNERSIVDIYNFINQHKITSSRDRTLKTIYRHITKTTTEEKLYDNKTKSALASKRHLNSLKKLTYLPQNKTWICIYDYFMRNAHVYGVDALTIVTKQSNIGITSWLYSGYNVC